MSTGDYVRYLRALKGGPTPLEIEQATGVPAGAYRQIEQRYRSVGSAEELAKLAEYFGVPADDLIDRSAWSRKDFSAALVDAEEQGWPLRIDMRHGQSLTGVVLWSDLGSFLLELEDGRRLVVQRHMVDRWEILED